MDIFKSTQFSKVSKADTKKYGTCATCEQVNKRMYCAGREHLCLDCFCEQEGISNEVATEFAHQDDKPYEVTPPPPPDDRPDYLRDYEGFKVGQKVKVVNPDYVNEPFTGYVGTIIAFWRRSPDGKKWVAVALEGTTAGAPFFYPEEIEAL